MFQVNTAINKTCNMFCSRYLWLISKLLNKPCVIVVSAVEIS